jgi:hypothetical protein
MRFDEPELEELRCWGLALREADKESVAAGRAILMLIEELERLRLDLWRTREQLDRIDRPDNEVAAAPVASVLHDRLRRILARDQDSGQPLEVRPRLLERQIRAWTATARPHRRVPGSRHYDDRSNASWRASAPAARA